MTTLALHVHFCTPVSERQKKQKKKTAAVLTDCRNGSSPASAAHRGANCKLCDSGNLQRKLADI